MSTSRIAGAASAVDFTRGWTRVVFVGDLPAGHGGAGLCGPAMTFARMRSELPPEADEALGHAAEEGYALGKDRYPEEDVIVTARLSHDEDRVWVTVGHFPTGAGTDQDGSDSDAAELEFLYERRAPKERERRVEPREGRLPPPRSWEGPAR